MAKKRKQQKDEIRGSEIVACAFNTMFEQHIESIEEEINMAIIIQNVDKYLRGSGKHVYQLRINKKVICTFLHNREEGLAQCLRKAADAVDEAKEEKK